MQLISLRDLPITSLWDIGLAHTPQFFVSMLLQAATILPDLVKQAPDWRAPPAKKKKKKLQPLSSSHPVPHHYKFTTLRRTIYTVVFVCKTHLCIIFVGYFTTLSVIQTIKCQMEVWFMNDELERIWKKKEHSQDSRWCRWDMNQAVPKYKYNLMLLMSLCMRQGYELSLPVLKNYLESTWNKLKNFL